MFVSSNICNVTVRLVAAVRARRLDLIDVGRPMAAASRTIIARSAEPFIVAERRDATVSGPRRRSRRHVIAFTRRARIERATFEKTKNIIREKIQI